MVEASFTVYEEGGVEEALRVPVLSVSPRGFLRERSTGMTSATTSHAVKELRILQNLDRRKKREDERKEAGIEKLL